MHKVLIGMTEAEAVQYCQDNNLDMKVYIRDDKVVGKAYVLKESDIFLSINKGIVIGYLDWELKNTKS